MSRGSAIVKILAGVVGGLMIIGVISGANRQEEAQLQRAAKTVAAATPEASAAARAAMTPHAPTPMSPPPSPPPQQVSAPAEPTNVTAEQLRRDYDANEVVADERYRGKVVDVTGIVKAVKKDVFGEPYVELSTSNLFESVHARFASGHSDVLSEFRRGDKVIVRCIGNNVIIGSPQVKNCVLQHHYRRSAE